MTSARPTPMTDERLVRINAAYTEKVNAAVQADQEALAYELAELTFPEELSAYESRGVRSPAGRPAGRRARGHRPPTTIDRVGQLTRRSLRRFDRYTLDVFNPRPPHALYSSRPDRSV